MISVCIIKRFTDKQEKNIMRTGQMILTVGFVSLWILILGCGAATEAGPEKAANEHVELITAGTHSYGITLGGTLDEFNTTGYFDTYLGFKRIESKFQPNKCLIIENIGDTDIINPWIVVNGRPARRSLKTTLTRRATPIRNGPIPSSRSTAITAAAASMRRQTL
jgi:hypothetical protein